MHINRAYKITSMDKEKSIWKTEKYRKWHAEYAKRWRLANPQLRKKHDRTKELKRLGSTIESFEQLLKDQKGKCAICCLNFKEEEKKPVLDHDHATGAIRGILCQSCNMQLGHIEKQRIKSFTFFNEAIEYLKSRSTNELK